MFVKCLTITIFLQLRAYINTCRPALIIDGAHLKGEFKGKMLLAVGMDGNNQIVPVAYGICKSECTEAWTWFLEQLKNCIGESDRLAIISDRADSIIAAVARVFTTAHHGHCGHHLLSNVQGHFKKSVTTKTLFWKAAKAYKREVF